MSKTEDCQQCAFYNAFYRKGIFCFWEETQGLCSKRATNVVGKHNTCENCKPYEGTTVTLKALDSVMEDIKALIKIYENVYDIY